MNETERQDIIESVLKKYYDLHPVFYKDGFALHWLFACPLNVNRLYLNLIHETSDLISLLEEFRKKVIIDEYGVDAWYKYLENGKLPNE